MKKTDISFSILPSDELIHLVANSAPKNMFELFGCLECYVRKEDSVISKILGIQTGNEPRPLWQPEQIHSLS